MKQKLIQSTDTRKKYFSIRTPVLIDFVSFPGAERHQMSLISSQDCLASVVVKQITVCSQAKGKA